MEPFKKSEYFEIEYYELDDLVNTHYGLEGDFRYMFCCDQEAGNDTQHSFNIKKEKLSEWEQEQLDHFIHANPTSFVTRVVLTDLCNKGIIEPGNYLINVCW